MSSTNNILPTHIINDILKMAQQPFHVLRCEINQNKKNSIKDLKRTILIMRGQHPNAILLKNLSCWDLYRNAIENY